MKKKTQFTKSKYRKSKNKKFGGTPFEIYVDSQPQKTNFEIYEDSQTNPKKKTTIKKTALKERTQQPRQFQSSSKKLIAIPRKNRPHLTKEQKKELKENVFQRRVHYNFKKSKEEDNEHTEFINNLPINEEGLKQFEAHILDSEILSEEEEKKLRNLKPFDFVQYNLRNAS